MSKLAIHLLKRELWHIRVNYANKNNLVFEKAIKKIVALPLGKKTHHTLPL